MSYGGGEGRKNDEFARSLARIAVAQICESIGFHGFQQSALDILSDITCKYIQDIGKTSNFYANLAGRTQSNVFDIVHGLEDLGFSQGFVGASSIDHSLSESGIIKEMSQYIGVSEEVGFAFSVPHFPVIKERQSTPSFFHVGKTPPLDNIPSWLPCFPDPETYTNPNPTSAIINSIDQDQKVTPVVEHNGGREQVSNPFLVFPLEYGEKEVSLVSLPAKLVEEDVAANHSLWAKHISGLGTFAPVIHGSKSSDLYNDEGSKKIVVERRRSTPLKFHISKKCLATADRNSQMGNLEAMSWFTNDELRNEKKMRKDDAVVN